ncbi:MAG: hypothetical protein DMG97_30025, partial [Acidobacteria bacterium]
MSSEVSTVCEKCGAAIIDANAFCIRCGTQRKFARTEGAHSRFCTKCGSPLTDDTELRIKCGAPAGSAGGALASEPSSGLSAPMSS